MVSNKINMLNTIFTIVTTLFISCNYGNKESINTNSLVVYEQRKDSINRQPIEYYLNNKNCSIIAKNYYNKKFIPSDNDTTVELLNLPITDDTLLRPFYFWCLNKVISEADGALMEYVGVPARKYIEKYPNEFLHNMESQEYYSEKNNWITAINYSGYYENENADNKKMVANNFLHNITKNCNNCSKEQITTIKKLVNDCFKE